ncbi:ER membrane protein SH3-domain-containing protein [Irpex lacteus]|nr:ER membrane protein SH3-domain-containing protein [Irpex lacteus]
MGYRQAAVLASTCFFLGILFICLAVDYRVLFEPLTDETIQDGLEFYTTFFKSPPAIKALLHAVMGMGLLGLVGKLHKWDESAVFFSGSSLAVYVFALAVYITVGIPSSRTVASPVPNVDTREDQIEALRVLSAGNTIIIVLLGAILVLQVTFVLFPTCINPLTNLPIPHTITLPLHLEILAKHPYSSNRAFPFRPERSMQGGRREKKRRSGQRKRRARRSLLLARTRRSKPKRPSERVLLPDI